MDLRQQHWDLSLEILVPIRITRDKVVPLEAGRRLVALVDRIADILVAQESVPRDVVGQLYFPFMQLLTEAAYANQPDPLVALAWRYEDRLERIFSTIVDRPGPPGGVPNLDPPGR